MVERKLSLLLLFSILVAPAFLSLRSVEFDWGFFGHKLINRTAAFTLPVDLLPLYKSNIDFVIEHSVDPDRRRHASPLEAVRHYIDIDQWGSYPFPDVPRTFADAIVRYGDVSLLIGSDTIRTWSEENIASSEFVENMQAYLRHEVDIRTYELLDEIYIDLPLSWLRDSSEGDRLIFTEHFTEFGILPYHLITYQNRLESAFRAQDWPLVIRLSTEMGHYISDGHVPLHTTLNYNGQLTGQDGIHAFWESRIPELLSQEYDLFTGRAKYIEDMPSFFWQFILDSHLLVRDVLDREMELRQSFDTDKQYCFDERNERTVRIQCEEYALAYSAALDDMVEQQMRKAIAAVGSSWYTAWVDAGRPRVPGSKDLSIDSMTVVLADSTLAVPPRDFD